MARGTVGVVSDVPMFDVVQEVSFRIKLVSALSVREAHVARLSKSHAVEFGASVLDVLERRLGKCVEAGGKFPGEGRVGA